MTPTDALFWYAESALPQFRPIIGGLYVLDGPLDRERLGAGIDAALAVVPRLRQRVVELPLHVGLPEWVDDPHFDRSYHLRHVSLAPPGSRRQLLDLAAKVFATPLDRQRPLWEAYWIEGLEGGRSAYFLKMHHSMVDGVGSIVLLNAMTQRGRDEAPLRVPPPPRRRSRRAESSAPLGWLGSLARDNARASLSAISRAATSPLRAAADPRGTAEQWVRTFRGVGGMLSDAAQPAVVDPLAQGSTGLSRRFDAFDVPLERLRKLKAPLGATLNDVVLTALAGTLGAYYRERGHRMRALKCMVPMNLRGRDERDLMGNRVGMFNVTLPVGERRPELRLLRIREQTQAAKRDQRGAAAPLFVEAATLIPAPAFRWIARRAIGQVNVCCTNVPGLPERRYMAGGQIEAIYPYASVVEGTPLIVALLSYAGTIHVGVDTDPEAIPDPHRITELFESHLDELEALSLHATPRHDGSS